MHPYDPIEMLKPGTKTNPCCAHGGTPMHDNFTPPSPHRMLLLTLGLTMLTAFSFQGSRGLYESTEGRYAQCAYETMTSGTLLEPVLNGAPHWSKPPLAYLPMEAGIAILGRNAWGARGAQAVLFVLTAFFVFLTGRALWGNLSGAFAALVYGTAPFTVAAANTISTDNLLVLLQSMTMAFFWLTMRRNRSVYRTAFWASLGLAFFCKGPVGLFPLSGILPAYWLLRRQSPETPRLVSRTGLLTFALTGLTWYAVEIVRHPDLLDTWLVHETVGRLVSDEFHRNAEFHKIFTLYAPILLFGTGPWIIFFLPQVKRGGQTVRRAWDRVRHAAPARFAVCAFLLPLVLLLVNHSRLPLYLLPLFLPLALAMGHGLARGVANGKLQPRRITTTAVLLAFTLVTLKGASAYYPSHRNMAQLSQALAPILQEVPDQALVLVNSEPLNGLEFYLSRPIQVRQLPRLNAAEAAATENPGTVPTGTLLLARTKHLHTASAYLPENAFSTRYEDSYWCLAQLNRPLVLEK